MGGIEKVGSGQWAVGGGQSENGEIRNPKFG